MSLSESAPEFFPRPITERLIVITNKNAKDTHSFQSRASHDSKVKVYFKIPIDNFRFSEVKITRRKEDPSRIFLKLFYRTTDGSSGETTLMLSSEKDPTEWTLDCTDCNFNVEKVSHLFMSIHHVSYTNRADRLRMCHRSIKAIIHSHIQLNAAIEHRDRHFVHSFGIGSVGGLPYCDNDPELWSSITSILNDHSFVMDRGYNIISNIRGLVFRTIRFTGIKHDYLDMTVTVSDCKGNKNGFVASFKRESNDKYMPFLKEEGSSSEFIAHRIFINELSRMVISITPSGSKEKINLRRDWSLIVNAITDSHMIRPPLEEDLLHHSL